MSSLAVESVKRRFVRGQEAELISALDRLDLAAELRPIESTRDIEMNPDGTIGSRGHRPTDWCLYQICQAACSGFYRSLTALTADGAENTRLAAVGMLNQVIRLSFASKLHGRMLLYDHENRTVDAMVSPQYRFLSNRRYYAYVAEVVAEVPGTTRLFEAEICGRWFFSRHYSVSPLFQAWDGLNYHAGWHFSNHEGGRAALRGLSAIVRGRDALVMLRSRPRGAGFPHRRKGFEAAYRDLVSRVVSHTWQVPLLEAGLRRMFEVKLGLGAEVESDEKRRSHRLACGVARVGRIPQVVAAKIVAGAILQPYDEAKSRPKCSLDRAAIASRTFLDLAAAASREAKNRGVAMRELIEQFAYRCLLGWTA